MDRKLDAVELFRAYSVEELQSPDRTPVAARLIGGRFRGEDSSSQSL